MKSQILNDFLTHRREAIFLKNHGQYWLGLDELKTLLSGVPLTPENYVKADEIIDEIGKIESASYTRKDAYHEGIRSLDHFQKNYRDHMSKKQFNSILRRITQILQSEGYFDILNEKYGRSMSEIDKITAIVT